jgi:hypothetical protein
MRRSTMLRTIIVVLAVLAGTAEALKAQSRNNPIGRAIAGEAEAGRQNSVAAFDETRRIPEAGGRVRITAPDMGLHRVTGSIAEVRADGAILMHRDRGDGPPVWIESSLISKLEVSNGQKGNTLKGMGIGLLVGSGVGIALGMTAEGDGWFSRGDTMMMMGIVMSIPCALVGAIVGYANQTDSWVEAAVPAPNLNLYPALHESGVGVGLRLMVTGH